MAGTTSKDRLRWLRAIGVDSKTTPSEFYVAWTIEQRIRNSTGDALISREHIGRITGLGDRRISEIIVALETRLWLSVWRANGLANRYRLTWPPSAAADDCKKVRATDAPERAGPMRLSARNNILREPYGSSLPKFPDRAAYEAQLASILGIEHADLAIPDGELSRLCLALKHGRMTEIDLAMAIRLQQKKR